MAKKRTMCFLLKVGAVSIALLAMSSFARAEAVIELSYDLTLDMTRPDTILNIHARDHVTLVFEGRRFDFRKIDCALRICPFVRKPKNLER